MSDDLESAKYKVQLASAKIEQTTLALFFIIAQEAKFLTNLRFELEVRTAARSQILAMIKEREAEIAEGLKRI